jgi:hypothetical protein
LAVGATVFYVFEDPEPAFFSLAMCGALTAWYAWAPVEAVASATKAQALQIIADAIGCSYSLTSFAPDGIELFKEMSLLPGYDRAEWNDRFAGVHHGCAFAFFDGHLEQKVQTKNGTSWKTVYRGQLICIDFPKKFLGTTVVRRDAGFFNFLQRWSTSLQRVGLPDSIPWNDLNGTSYIQIGKVVCWPAVNVVTTTSSNDSAKASIPPATRAVAMLGSVT